MEILVKTFRHISISAALLLLTLGAITAKADTGYAYALIVDNGGSPQVSAGYTLNPLVGGPVTVTSSSTGFYTVYFPNSGIRQGWLVDVAAWGATGGYCNDYTLGSFGSPGYVSVACYNSSGTVANSSFTVLAVSQANDKNIVFALADQPTATSVYAPNPSYSNNPFGAIAIDNVATGKYTVTFSGLNSHGGTVQVGAVNSSATCYSAGWALAFTASVDCFDPSGNPVNTVFGIFVVPAGVTPAGLAFTLADQPTTASYTPTAEFSYNPTGNAVNVTRSSAGQYLVTYAGLDLAQVIGGAALVTAYGAVATRCQVTQLAPGPGSTLQVGVGCYNIAGGPTDSEFLVLVLPPIGYAYASVGITGIVDSAYSLNPGGAPVTAIHNSTGNYAVTFPNSGIGYGWSGHAVANGPGANYCGLWGLGAAGKMTVLCFNSAGMAADSAFIVSAISNTNGENMAFALVSKSNLDSLYSYNPGGTINYANNGVGLSTVTFIGLGPASAGNPAGTLQVTAANGSPTCRATFNGGNNLNADVSCQDPSGAPEYSDFVVSAIPGGATPSGIGFAWADRDTAPSYTPNSCCSYNPSGGGVNVVRSAVGPYIMTFSGLNPAQVYGGAALVTGAGNPCKINGFSAYHGTVDVKVNVDCYNYAGVSADSQFTVLVFAPVVGPAAQVVIPGAAQSAVVNTPFAPALSATVEDATGNPVPYVYVTFTAVPGPLGASGSFLGRASTATVMTNASGVATAPTFTANNIPGSYGVSVSFLGAPDITTMTVTNTPPPSVTVNLDTSPSGLLVSVDGGTFVPAPSAYTLVSGSNHTIATESPQAGGAGTQYVWQNWSDGGAISHSIVVPTTATTYTANFQKQYQLTVAASPSAGGTVTPASGTYYNSAVTVPIAATANAGYTFGGWTGTVANANNASTTVTMSAPEIVTANFLPPTGITIHTSPTGLQFSVDGGAAQTAPKTLSLSQGTHTIAVVVTQPGPAGTPAGTQCVFGSWSDSGSASHSITVGSSAATYTASFTTQYQLTISASPAAGGTVTPASGAYYNAGTAQPITAVANAGYTFNNWSGSIANPSSASTTVNMSTPEKVFANFSSTTGITIQTSPPNLQFSVDGGASQSAPQVLTLSQGTHTVAVVATQAGPAGTPAGTRYVFTSWSDGGAASHSIVVSSSAATYTAAFKTQYQLTTAALPASGGSVSPATGQFYDSGTSIAVTATPTPPYAFSSWSGSATGTANPITVTMNGAESVTGSFGLPVLPCQPTGDQAPSVADVQLIVNQALGAGTAANDLNGDGVVNVVDIQIVINAALSLGCTTR